MLTAPQMLSTVRRGAALTWGWTSNKVLEKQRMAVRERIWKGLAASAFQAFQFFMRLTVKIHVDMFMRLPC